MNIQPIIERVKETVRSHELGGGAYRRYLEAGPSNEYGCADAANIRYTVGDFERDPEKRAALVNAIRAFQHEDGSFDEGTHHPIHCTAHCTAALELFDAAPALPLTVYFPYRTEEGLRGLLEGLQWVDSPWGTAHLGAGIYAAFVLTGNASPEWQDFYFSWLESHADHRYGIGLEGAIDKGVKPAFQHLNGWFHYLFNFVFARRPIPYAKQVADTCIELYRTNALGVNFAQNVGFSEIDWVFTLHRATAQEGYRVGEAKELFRKFAKDYIDYLSAVDVTSERHWNDLHCLFGMVCALAELQLALPGEIGTAYPLKIVLDRRPFI